MASCAIIATACACRDVSSAVAERLRASVQALGLPHSGSPGDVVSVSVGVASLNQRVHTDYGSLIQAADDALYEAKRSGRNIVRASTATRNES